MGVAGIVLGALVVVVVTLSSLAPGNTPVLTLPASLRGVVHDVAPEGWQFFTKDPQDPSIIPYRMVSGRWEYAQLQGSLHFDTIFGLDRIDRAQGVELGILASQIPENAWLPCKVAPTTCLEKIPVELTLRDTQPYPTLCGDIGFANQAPVPWNWARRNPVPVMPSSFARVRVACPR
jgi:antimicrobial peptide system SdpA family protein